MNSNPPHDGARYDKRNMKCLFTEDDWKVWEKISREQKLREFKNTYRIRELTSYRFIKFSEHKIGDQFCEYKCNYCNATFRKGIASAWEHLFDIHYEEITKSFKETIPNQNQ